MLQFLYSVFLWFYNSTPYHLWFSFCIVDLLSDSFNVNVLYDLRISWYGDMMELVEICIDWTHDGAMSLKEIDIEQNCRTLCMSEWCVCVCVCVVERNDKGKENWVSQKQMIHALFCTDHRSFPWIFTQLKREIEYVSVLWSVTICCL